MTSTLNDTESEVILLKAVMEIVDSMVNFEMLELRGEDPDSEIAFPTSTHQEFFNVLLVDFLSFTDDRGIIRKNSYLGGLGLIAHRPAFGLPKSIEPLGAATAEFKHWLDEEIEVGTWLPSIRVQTNLKQSRCALIKMCGDISKHNSLRAIGVVDKLRDALAAGGVQVSREDALAALPDFYVRFHTDILNYHSSTIAEFLNNIRWGIYEYLQPEMRRSIISDGGGPPTCSYRYPDEVQVQFARNCYWSLMNEIRTAPYMRRFRVTKRLKLRY